MLFTKVIKQSGNEMLSNKISSDEHGICPLQHSLYRYMCSTL